MTRSIFCTLALSLLLSGCNFGNSDLENRLDLSAETNQENVVSLEVGAVCGIVDGTACMAGSECFYAGDDEAGTCQLKQVDESITCTKEKKPVCGQKGRNRVGYLNECEAQRHGAEIVGDRFCEFESIAEEDLCTTPVLALGNCSDPLTGFEFDAALNDCKPITLRGCELFAPFEDEVSCDAACVVN